MNFYVLTLFPEMILCGLNHSIIKKAFEKNPEEKEIIEELKIEENQAEEIITEE